MSDSKTLRRLASLYGIQTSYRDIFGRRQSASPDSMVQILGALGATVSKGPDPAKALREREAQLASRVLEPVTPTWEGKPCLVTLRLREESVPRKITSKLVTEAGQEATSRIDPQQMPVSGRIDIDGTQYRTLTLHVSSSLPPGYHRFSVSFSGNTWETLIICAPLRTFDHLDGEKSWGLFAPLYALHSRRWGSGDLTDLGRLMTWVSDLGGRFTATLPLFPLFLQEPFEPSPYAPVSRLFWNEFYVDPAELPELEWSEEAKRVLESPQWSETNSQAVDYRRLMSMKRHVLESLAAVLYSSKMDERRDELQNFLRERPEVENYARFRAEMEARKTPWQEWTPGVADDALHKGLEANFRYHVYAQFAAHQQVHSLGERDAGLYLDVPLGIHPDGYDAWRYQNLFCRDVAGGAPPDDFFRNGQNWGFHPLHPEKIREDRYRYVIATIRHIFKHARFVRLDHVMGLHRLFWIPHGADATDGVYVHYPTEELYAIVCLESNRQQTTVIGEDLGTVPAKVRRSMRRHGLYRSSILTFELREDPSQAVASIPTDSFAALNTHDTPTFGGWWEGRDIEDRIGMGLLTAEEAQRERTRRERLKEALQRFLRRRGVLKGTAGRVSALQACLSYLADSPSQAVVVTLEDLWGELHPQNVPGTTSGERPNWQRRMRFPVEEILTTADVMRALELVQRHRTQVGGVGYIREDGP